MGEAGDARAPRRAPSSVHGKHTPQPEGRRPVSEPPVGPELPRAYGPPPARAALSADPEDFRVTEVEKFLPRGDGPHAWLRIRKRGLNTEEVAIALARVAGVPRSAVGFAGMKDRLAVATQWFSVDLAGRAEPRWVSVESAAIEVLDVARHHRKLRRGALLGNRFRIVLRDGTGAGPALDERLDTVRAGGVPNYFGPQRFGRDGSNLRFAASLLVEGRRIRDRHRRSLALSAARALVFNRVLAARVESRVWAAPLSGDVMMLDGRGSVFALGSVDDATVARTARGEIHPTGPLWGRGQRLVDGAAREIEDRVVAGTIALCRGLERERLEQDRRALRVPVRELECRIEPDGSVLLSFSLPRGAYATVVLEELFALDRFR